MSGSSAGEPHRRGHVWRRVALTAVPFGLAAMAVSGLSAVVAKQSARKGPVGRLVPAELGVAWPGAAAVVPAPNAADVSVTDPVTVTATSTTLDTVTLTDAEGKQVPGDFDADRRRWHATARLGYNQRYTLTATAPGPGGRRPTRSSVFTTVKPANLTLAYLQANAGLPLADRQTYGVGQPIVVRFDEKVPDRTAAQKALEVVTEPHVDGAWHWFGDQELHWRPPVYWTPGTKVTVNANLYGKNLGRGLYGQGDVAASFTVGPAKIAIADDDTHHILVWIDGQQVRDIPTAMGKHESTPGAQGENVDFRTRSGVHVVLGNERVTHMTSASFGITSGPNDYDEQIEWTTHLSYAGEYLHAAPWSVAQQGHSDASHGCLNVDTENAIWLYNTFGPGDIVEVRNTGIALEPTDGLGDWNIGREEWVAGSALPPPRPASVRSGD